MSAPRPLAPAGLGGYIFILGASIISLVVMLLISSQLYLSIRIFPNMLKGLGSAGLLSLPFVTSSSATLLYVSSYAGTVTTLNLTLPSGDTCAAALEAISTSTGCGSSPSWLTLDSSKSVVYCLDEGLSTPAGTLSSLQTNSDGSLVQIDQLSVISGPVSAVIYGDSGDGLALAQ